MTPGKTWPRLTVGIRPDQREIVGYICWEAGCTGIIEKDNTLHVFFNILSSARAAAGKLRETFPEINIQFDTIRDTGWSTAWHKFFQPTPIGESFIVLRPEDTVESGGRIPLFIHPGQAFGTGHHETTALLMNRIDTLDVRDRAVLDVGCGSGILGFAALMKGARHVLGVDIDPVALTEAKRNARFNNLSTRCRWIAGSLTCLSPKMTFDLVLANINRNTLIDLREQLIGSLVPDGLLLLSGFLRSDIRDLLGVYETAELRLREEASEGEWCALCFEKTGHA